LLERLTANIRPSRYVLPCHPICLVKTLIEDSFFVGLDVWQAKKPSVAALEENLAHRPIGDTKILPDIAPEGGRLH
jgi:hypothetical protein